MSHIEEPLTPTEEIESFSQESQDQEPECVCLRDQSGNCIKQCDTCKEYLLELLKDHRAASTHPTSLPGPSQMPQQRASTGVTSSTTSDGSGDVKMKEASHDEKRVHFANPLVQASTTTISNEVQPMDVEPSQPRSQTTPSLPQEVSKATTSASGLGLGGLPSSSYGPNVVFQAASPPKEAKESKESKEASSVPASSVTQSAQHPIDLQGHESFHATLRKDGVHIVDPNTSHVASRSLLALKHHPTILSTVMQRTTHSSRPKLLLDTNLLSNYSTGMFRPLSSAPSSH